MYSYGVEDSAMQSVRSPQRLQALVDVDKRKDYRAGCSCTVDLNKSINSMI